jgi:hypothetical protein
VNASFRLSFVLFAFLAVLLPACATTTEREAESPPRGYRESLITSEVTLRSGQETPSVLSSHERMRPSRAAGTFTTGPAAR